MRTTRSIRTLVMALPIVFAAGGAVVAQTAKAPPASGTRVPPAGATPRVVITADPELDDLNTLVRALLYSTDFTIEGLVYTSSGFHWKGDGKGTTLSVPGREYTRNGLNLCPCTSWRWAPDERFIDDLVDGYAKVHPNLRAHSPRYPTPATLRSKIRWGNVEFDGEFSKDTPGSDLIKALLLDNQPGPLFVTAQGGQSTIARALKSIEEQYASKPGWAAIRQKVSRKLVILPSGDQDGTYPKYIKPNWPEVEAWQLTGANFGYAVRNTLAPENAVYVSAEWTREHVSSRGPLGATYRVWGDGKQMVKGDIFDYFGISGQTSDQLKALGYVVWTPPQEKGSFIGEGDTPTFINLVANGLRAFENGTYGGWGGRTRNDAGTAAAGPGAAPSGGTAGTRGAVVSPRTTAVRNAFFGAAQRDFAARLQWSVSPAFKDANHEPDVTIVGGRDVEARPGATVRLRASVTDPDRDAISTRWWQYSDAGTYPGDVEIANPATLDASLRVPADAKDGQTIHVVLEATDQGIPPLTRYGRVVVTVRQGGTHAAWPLVR